MEIRATEITIVPLTQIKLNPKNRNKHSKEQIDHLAKIIAGSGFRRPGTISNQSGFLTCGEARYLAAKQLGLYAMPVMFQDYDSPEIEYADGVADNALDKWAELDLGAINADLPDMGPMDIDLLGIKDFVLDMSEKFDSEQSKGSMHDKFGAPPFSVLDARQGWWQERKRQWLSLGIQSELGRGGKK